jgi:hypothetical protein
MLLLRDVQEKIEYWRQKSDDFRPPTSVTEFNAR